MTSTLTPPPQVEERPIAGERCDRCSAAAKLRVTLAEGGDLVFCGHHANQFAEKLVPIAIDFTADPEFEWRGTDLMASQN
jgi:hypothetical protein